MPSTETLIVFCAAALLMNLSPGPSNLYVMSRSLGGGAGAGALAAAGLALGGMVHAVAAAAGVSAFIAYSPAAYLVLKVAGGCYLVYLGARLIESAKAPQPFDIDPEEPPAGRRSVLAESALVEITNPKTALFFLAFLPQFVDLDAGPAWPQMLVLGLIVVASAIPCDLLVAFAAGRMASFLRDSPRARQWLARLSGSILLALGAYVLFDAREQPG